MFIPILPVIHKIVNLSLETGRMPGILKQAILKPLLKKPSLDSNDFKNYRPISNLCFISKTIEKCVAKQLIQYLDMNDLGETFQSAYKRNHSTEMALKWLYVHNDIAVSGFLLYVKMGKYIDWFSCKWQGIFLGHIPQVRIQVTVL